MALSGFLAAADRDEVILVVLRPRLVLGGFTATPATTMTYHVGLARAEGTTVIGGGVSRRVGGVRENAVDLTARTSIATVEATASSWWWDEAAERLYVHSSTGSDPDTFTTYQAIVEFAFATTPIVLDRIVGDPNTGIYHHPWVAGGIPELIERDDEQVFASKMTRGGRVSFQNGHGWWDRVIAHDGAYRWKHASVCFLLGGSYQHGTTVLTRAEYAALVTMLVEDAAAEEGLVELELKPYASRLHDTVPKTPYFSSIYPNLGDGVSGTKHWIGYGRTTMRPDLTDTSSHGVYTIADASLQTLFAVNQAWAVQKTTGVKTPLMRTTDYTVNLTACTVTVVTATYAWQDYELELDVTGKPDGAGRYLKTFGAIVQDILTTGLGVRTADIDTRAFTQADLDAPQEIALWVKAPRSLASILSTAQQGFPALERSVQGLLFQTPDGRWTVDIWSPSYDPATLPTIRKTQFSRFRPEPTLEAVFRTVRVHYDYNHATESWRVEEATDAAIAYEHDTTDALEVYTYLRAPSDAVVLGQRLLVVTGGLSLDVEFEEVGVTLATTRVRDRVLVDYAPAPVAATAFAAAPFELVRIDRRFAPSLQVSGRLQNLRGVGQFIGTWRADTAPNYRSATAAERAVSGFWADANGAVVPGDPMTHAISRWW